MERLRVSIVAVALLATALLGCQRAPERATSADERPWVVTAAPRPLGGQALGLSGTVRARIEAPLAFQVGGRIVKRHADAGQAVRAGQVLFELDAADLEQAVRAAEADLAAAETAARTAQADLDRVRALQAQSFVSAQALERAQLSAREAASRRDAAQARLAQVRNNRGYAALRAPADGVLTDVTGQPGQVVAAGQPVATLAQAGAREVEVQLPDGVTPPPRGEAQLPGGHSVALTLREAAPVVDPLGRTRRARYRAPDLPAELPLGSVVAVRLAGPNAPTSAPTAPAPAAGAAAWVVPVGALDERAEGPRVWRVREGKLEAVPVRVLRVDDRQALVVAPLAPQDRIVALGTHLLQPGMAVRERAS
ncbi:RND family efflux transporter MFP subunit [Tepidimonas ignava]|uniref:Multidrug resistance protein MdtE n=1 Tax=Tepidimonas ignava TaxID=114249 RepID=A0A4R3L8L2_9BURK|nr:efflux RND transporter periplasmic adaptor subunit [Tepidimonas ignava]TCS95390.1 RND family efflux transporter MFP subunit [Tepidimonas ignava]TSE20003.1 Multidrug resistance protein MdtE [Tepidimonas ignava]